jgi:hypothetical protein
VIRRTPALLLALVLANPAIPVWAKDVPEVAVSSGQIAAGSAHAVALRMAAAAQEFVASLDEKTRAVAVMSFDDPKRMDWHNIPKPERKGLQVKNMTEAQKKLAHALVRSALSDTGYAKACRIMSLENNLREGEKGQANAPLRDPERYFLTIFGDPVKDAKWGWSFEGHHLSMNFAVDHGLVVGDTPSFWGANPATVDLVITGGPDKGVRTLAQEEQLAFDLLNMLDDGQRAKTVIAEKAPADYRNAGKPQPPSGPAEGLPASAMTEAQKKLLGTILETYSGNIAPELAAARLAEIKADGLDKVSFAWSGSTKPGVGHYYRITGPSFVLELVNVQSGIEGHVANHIHSVWRSLKHDFGVATR